jgi:hypothetical protein
MPDHPCAHCERAFDNVNSLYQHTKAKHGRKAAKGILPPSEPSLGEELSEALIAYACGEPVDDWIMDMFPDHFARGSDA